VAAALLGFAVGRAQVTSERLIVKDNGDSLMLHAFRAAFDTNGNYYFETLLRGKGSKFALITNNRRYNPVYSGNTAVTQYKSVLADAFFPDSVRRTLLYKNKSGTRLYGPRPGRIRELLEFGKDNIAVELVTGAKSQLYINDTLVNTADTLLQQWQCQFSDNGKVMYSIRRNNTFYLYLNYRLIDSSSRPFSEISVNDNNFYVYAKAENGKFVVRTSTGKYGPFGAVDYSDLWNNNAWFVRGCADSSCYVLVNGELFSNIPESHSFAEDPATGGMVFQSDEQITVVPTDATHFMFVYNKQGDDNFYLNQNGKVTRLNYSYTGLVETDKKQGYAMLGARFDSVLGADRLFRYVNGREYVVPVTQGRVTGRAACLQAGPDGSSTIYYETRDSVHLFHNNELQASAPRKRFMTWDAAALPQAHPDGLERFTGINIDNSAYIVYNNTISRPLPLVFPEYDRLDGSKKGSIVAGDINPNGFFVIENIGKGKYMLVINNTIYRELEGIDRIFGDQGYFTGRSVIFYGLKGNGFYEFRVDY
jgi:hypothetical protein